MRIVHAIMFFCSVVITLIAGCAADVKPGVSEAEQANSEGAGRDANRLLIVDCLLPGQLRSLGRSISFLTPRRPVKVSASECAIRGGEYVAYDRANFATSLKIWLPKAKAGDAEAQVYVGEIYEKGLGQLADPSAAAEWYRRASEQGNTRASINLGYLYETGLGVEQNLVTAMNYYRAAAGFEESRLEYVTSMEVVARKAQKQQIIDMQGQIATLEASNRELIAERNSLERQNARVASLEREVEEKRREVASLVSQGAANAAAVSSAPAADAPVVDESDDATEIVGNLLGEIDQLESRLAKSEQGNKDLFAQLSSQQQLTSDLRKKVASANSELNDARDQLNEQKNRVRSIENRLAEKMDDEAAAADESKLTAELADQLQKELAAAEKEIATQERFISQLEQGQSTETIDLNRQLRESETREGILKASIADAKADVDRLNIVVRNKERLYQEKLAEIDQLQSESSKQLRDKQREIAALELEVNEMQAREVVNESEVSKAQSRLARLEQEAAAQREQLQSENSEQLRDKQRQIAALELQVSELQTREVVNESEVSKAQSKLTRLEQEVAAQREQLIASSDYKQQASLATAELSALERELNTTRQQNLEQRNRIQDLERDVANKRALLPRPEPTERQVTTVAAGPLIEIIEPPVTIMRGAFALPMPGSASDVELIGRVRPADKVISFKVNGVRNEINANGIFSYLANIEKSSEVRLTAVDDVGERAELNLSLVGDTAVAAANRGAPSTSALVESVTESIDLSGIEFGNYHALIIGNQDYDQMGDLRTSVNDAIELERVLRVKYGFATELLQNADRFDILAALNRKRDELTEEDNLLIYFAGHGELANGKGYWLPTDAEPGSTDNWISSVSVTDLVDSMDAKHVMIVADSCYSGTMSRSSVPRLRKDMPAAQKAQWYQNVSGSKVRTVLTSGGVRPVIDGLPDSRHSIFAEAFIEVLSSSDGVVEAYDLFASVQEKVRNSAASIGLEQDPRYSPIQFAGHESGEFLFVGNGS